MKPANTKPSKIPKVGANTEPSKIPKVSAIQKVAWSTHFLSLPQFISQSYNQQNTDFYHCFLQNTMTLPC
jgi:hypothetical protein